MCFGRPAPTLAFEKEHMPLLGTRLFASMFNSLFAFICTKSLRLDDALNAMLRNFVQKCSSNGCRLVHFVVGAMLAIVFR
jgi:hypothetical protein